MSFGREVNGLSRNVQIAIAVVAVILAAVLVAGATQAPGTPAPDASAGVAAPDAQASDAPVGCHVDAQTWCHGSEGCPGPDSEDCRARDGSCEQDCRGDDGAATCMGHRGGWGGCHTR